MQQLIDRTEHLASSVVALDPADLPALAELHDEFRAVGDLLGGGEGPALGDAVLEGIRRAERLVEAIVLCETPDTPAALSSIADAVSGLQAAIRDGGDEVGVTKPKPPMPLAPAGEAAAVAPAAEDADEPPVKADDAALVVDFIAEAGEHIAAAEAALLRVEDDPGDVEAVNAVFRGFHTVKGVAGFLNLRQIGTLAHAAENLLDLARKGRVRLAGDRTDLVLESVDLLKSLLSDLGSAVAEGVGPRREPRLPGLLERLHACAEGRDAGAAPAPEVIPVVAPEAAPGEVAATPVDEAPTPSAPPSPAAPPRRQNGGGDTTVKVATDRLDSLINMVGELVIAQSMVAQSMTGAVTADPKLARDTVHLGKITRELQDLAMSMRMVPIQGVFAKMGRVVRDLAKKVGKDVDLVVVGGETELDRNLVEAIADPLVHMVRNSVDHGLESPDARRAAGKPPTGRVQLKAYHQAGNIVIEIADDGKGLDKERLLKKAIEAGIVREGQEVGEQEIFRLIFHAGLSTAEALTDVSGRGVGMDVVRKNVEALRGRIDIASVAGRGTTFSIRLPLTLAVIDGLVVRVGGDHYILPITSIEQSLRPVADQLSTAQGRGEACMIRGSVLPLFRLHELFGTDPDATDPTEALVVIVHDNGRRCCLMVDELLGQEQVVIKSLGEGIGTRPGISGGAIRGDGNISLILDVPGLMDLAQR